MIWNIFETPWLLISLSALLLVAAGFCRQVKPEWGYWPMLAPVLIALLAVGLDYFVQTDSEAITGLIDTCRRSALAGTSRGMEPVISEQYSDSAHKNKEVLLASIDAIVDRVALTRVDVRSHTIDVQGNRAQSTLRFRIMIDPRRSEYPLSGGLLFVIMVIDYERNPQGEWQIIRTEVQSVNDTPMGWSNAP